MPTVNHGRDLVMLWGGFSLAWTGKLAGVDREMNRAKLTENHIEVAKNLRLKARFTCQQSNNLKYTARTTVESLGQGCHRDRLVRREWGFLIQVRCSTDTFKICRMVKDQGWAPLY